MRKIAIAVLMSASLGIAVLATHGAQAAIHGCISGSGLVNVTSGSGGPVNTQTTTCDFTWVGGDTFSGAGDFTIWCPLHGAPNDRNTWTHAVTDEPANQEPLVCDDGSTVLVTLSPGATVAAGNTM